MRLKAEGALAPEVPIDTAVVAGVNVLASPFNFICFSSAQMLSRNLLVYGGGGILVPFLAIKLIDLLITPFMR